MYNICFKYLLSQNFIKEKHNIKSNNLEISKLAKLRKNKIKISGDNNILHIEDGALIRNCNFMIKGNNNKLYIGKNCMISYDTEIRNTDSHMIYDLETKERINYGKEIEIGNNVWIGTRAIILKGAFLYNKK